MISDQAMVGKVVLCTGAARGIGFATAKAFADRGAIVYAADILDEFDDPASSGSLIYLRLDVRSEQQVSELIDRIVREQGKLDYAFNNAGIMAASREAEWDAEQFNVMMDINATGVMRCMKHELRVMAEAGTGAIVNMASMAGIVGIRGAISYAASKHAVVGMTRAAALQYAEQGVRINALCPGPTETAMTALARARSSAGGGKAMTSVPMGRRAAPEEMAEAVVWMCSDSASYMTGHAMAVDGGYAAG